MSFISKYKWLWPAPAFTFALLACRIAYSHSPRLIFIPWNLLLAALPLYFAYMLNRSTGRLRTITLFMAWLLFFPNSMYIVTDLFHLKKRVPIPLWYDLLILASAALTGIIMGFASLSQAERFLARHIPQRYMRLILPCIFMLSGYGIYLGRYLRWNSWDLIAQPSGLLADVLYQLAHPWRSRECWLLTLLFGIWMYILYGFFRRQAGNGLATGNGQP